MPHVKNLRVANVHFNNATQVYEDLAMDFAGKNSTYDLENGGGKSVLFMMLLQTVLPKTNLRREKPIGLLFQGGKERTSHVVVEWILEEGGAYKYLLTGFAARKRKGAGDAAESEEEEEQLLAGDVEHLNWCVFHKEQKPAGVHGVPLVREQNGKKSYASFEDIRKYIQQMKQKGLPAEVFDKIEQYQQYIAGSGLIAAEWNIIRGINSGENNIEVYFRQDATSRKLIENRFVKIIEEMEAMNRGDKQGSESLLLADILIDIRSRLNEYLTLKGHMAEYERIKEYYREFGEKNTALLQVLTQYEQYKQEGAAIGNLIRVELEALGREEEAAASKLEYHTKSCEEGRQLKAQLEAGLVNHEKKALEALHKEMLLHQQQLELRYAALKEQVNELLALEGYGTYRQETMRIHELEKSLKSLQDSADTQEEEYQTAGGRLKFLWEKMFVQLTAALEEEIAVKNRLKETQQKAQQGLVAAEKREAVLAVAIESLETQTATLAAQQRNRSAFFLERGETEALLSAEKFLIQAKNALAQYEQEAIAWDEQEKAVGLRLQQLVCEDAESSSRLQVCRELKDQRESWLEKYREEYSRMETRAEVLGENTLTDYQKRLRRLIDTEGLYRLEKEIEVGRLRQKKQLSGARGYYVPNEEVLTLTERLGEKCEFVQAGIDWLAQSQPQEKEQLLRKMPYLPFSVLVDAVSFEKIKAGRISVAFASDYLVPVMNVETVRWLKEQEQAEILYLCSFGDLILDSSRYETYMHGLEKEIQAEEEELARVIKRIEETEGALSQLTAFFAQYPVEEVNNTNNEITKLKEREAALLRQQERIQLKISQGNQKKSDIQAQMLLLSRQQEECRISIGHLMAMVQTEQKLQEIRQELAVKKAEHTAAIKEIVGIQETMDHLIFQCDEKEDQINIIRWNRKEAEKEREMLAGFSEAATSLPLSRVQAEFTALKRALSGRLAEETELRQQLGSCKTRCVELADRIQRDYGRDLTVFAKREEAGEGIVLPSPAQIETLKGSRQEQEVKLEEKKQEIYKLSLKINSAEVRLQELTKGCSLQELQALPEYDSESRYQQEMETVKELIASYEISVAKTNEEIGKIRRNIERLGNQAEDYDGFLEREQIVNEGNIAQSLQDFRVFEREYYRLRDRVKTECDKWEQRLKKISEETLAFTLREPLEELEKISCSAEAKECRHRQGLFAEYIANLEEHMQKINNDIVQLESYQQDFVHRCIQRAELVLGHLRKVESLSRIEVHGRRINMIELRLREWETKDKILRMKAHVEGLVQEISEEGTVDRKRIAGKLAVKELLAQITDMENAVVRLYKIESIPENSRFYRWETAIGSEGQNNSLYFIFAACLISFIRMLSVTNSSIKTKKVIVADNPFGATSAVYLWEPMFKILKQNEVQLIAPGHRIPREITSRFGVSYLLNQEILEDGRLRVVVKDVRAEEEESVLRYVEPEQLSMFTN